MNKTNAKNITLVAFFMALVVIMSRIYVGTHDTFRFHLGNSMCLLASFFLTPFYAGIAAGCGSLIFDLVFYPSGISCIITLITKFAMSYIASVMFYKLKGNENTSVIKLIISGAVGELVYIILYAIKTYVERRYVLMWDIKATMPILFTKVGVSAINAIAAIIISSILYKTFKKLLKL